MCKDDFTFDVNRNRPFTSRFHFLKKKKKKPAGWRTTSPAMSSSTQTTWPYFAKKKFNDPFLQISVQIDLKIQKKTYFYSLNVSYILHALYFNPNKYWLYTTTKQSIKIYDLDNKSIVEDLKVNLKPKVEG